MKVRRLIPCGFYLEWMNAIWIVNHSVIQECFKSMMLTASKLDTFIHRHWEGPFSYLVTLKWRWGNKKDSSSWKIFLKIGWIEGTHFLFKKICVRAEFVICPSFVLALMFLAEQSVRQRCASVGQICSHEASRWIFMPPVSDVSEDSMCLLGEKSRKLWPKLNFNCSLI